MSWRLVRDRGAWDGKRHRCVGVRWWILRNGKKGGGGDAYRKTKFDLSLTQVSISAS